MYPESATEGQRSRNAPAIGAKPIIRYQMSLTLGALPSAQGSVGKGVDTGLGSRGFGMTGYSQVDALRLWYKMVNFEVRKSLGSH